RYSSHRAFDQERHALTAWRLSAVEDLQSMPRLLAVSESLRALLIAEVPGRRVSGDVSRVEAHRRAGKWLARFHGLPLDSRDAMPIDRALGSRLERWSARGAEWLGAAERRTLMEIARAGVHHFVDEHRVPCHRDFGEHNWIVDARRRLGVIDYEHSRPDHRWIDLVRLEVEVWADEPALRDAFASEYAPVMGDLPVHGDANRRRAFRALVALDGLATLVWARERGDPEFERRGRLALRWLEDRAI
ncbi:MAG: phosphotransferase, partial [Planctomycetes bacterium]|nr:phosphotransferase [Planctomycetota bacterium]